MEDDYLDAWKEADELRKQAKEAYDNYCLARAAVEEAERHAHNLWLADQARRMKPA